MKIGVETHYTVVVFSTDEIITGIFCPVSGVHGSGILLKKFREESQT